MTRQASRQERDAAWELQQLLDEQERHRKDALSMWMRIHESDASDDVKDILHRMAEHIGIT